MGIRGEIFSNKLMLPNRTYFFNVKENRMGDLYLNIVESKNKDSGGFDRQSVILFSDDLQEFLKSFDESLKVMEKAVREKRNSGSVKAMGASKERNKSGERGNDRGERKFDRSNDRKNDRGADRGTYRGSSFKKRSGDFNRNDGSFKKREGDFKKHEGSFKKREGDFKKREGSFQKREGDFKKRVGDRSRQGSGGKNRGREQTDDRGFEQKRGKRVVVKKKF